MDYQAFRYTGSMEKLKGFLDITAHPERAWKERIAPLQQTISNYEAGIQVLKSERKQRSAALQQKLFEQFKMLNYREKSRRFATSSGRPYTKPRLREPVSAPHPSCCNKPICTGGSLLQWQNSGGENPPKQRYGITDITIPPAKASASLYWDICCKVLKWTRIRC